MEKRVVILFLVWIQAQFGLAQYEFSGYIPPLSENKTVYLSLIEDFRKANRIYRNQIIAKVEADSAGFFLFKGAVLPKAKHLYRIHTENCSPAEIAQQSISGYCENTRSILFVANGGSKLHLPLSFDGESFCEVQGNDAAKALFTVDTMKEEMAFELAELSGEAAQMLGYQKWFEALKTFGEKSNEPLVQLYIYDFLSDRRNQTFDYYLKELSRSDHYRSLLETLQDSYPESSYTKQYEKELAADQRLLDFEEYPKTSWLKTIALLILVLVALFFSMYLRKILRKKKQLRDISILTKQEKVIFDLMLSNKTNKEIASEVFVSHSTVKTHVNNIYRKLNVTSREELKAKG